MSVATVKTFTCKACSKNGFPSLGQLRKHYKEAGHPTKTRRKRQQEPAIARDRERALLDATGALFDAELSAEELTQDAYDRVIAYLASRYGSPPTVDGPTE